MTGLDFAKTKIIYKKKFDKQTLSNADVYEVHFLAQEIEKFYSKKKVLQAV